MRVPDLNINENNVFGWIYCVFWGDLMSIFCFFFENHGMDSQKT